MLGNVEAEGEHSGYIIPQEEFKDAPPASSYLSSDLRQYVALLFLISPLTNRR